MLKIIGGSAVAALMMVAAPNAGVAAQNDTGKAPVAKQASEQATDFSSRHRYGHRYRYVRPYYRPYAYYPRSYYRPYYGSYGYYGNPYYRRPGLYLGFGF